ncbi:protein STABILIZED1 [Histomonas meleagridis]|uniref:protein STABILIZED1 n=1 Tax=Histomonas meleagridis TaxID=135588 RepID=UPI003559CA6B|nr:protein STABILIZED1 [Histomonas meleagridis]
MSYPFPWGPPPPGYIPGLGRGAVGFIDTIESAKVDIEYDIKSPKLARRIKEENDKADEFYEEIDRKMKERNKKKNKAPPPPEKTIFDEVRDKYADLKEGLKTISASEWENLPEIGATTYHRPKWELFTHASDRMITNDFDDSALNRLDKETDGNIDSDKRIMAVSRAQQSVLNIQLSKIVGPHQQSIDVTSFMRELDQQASTVIQQFDDLDRAASLYRSLTHANKDNPQGWLLRARVEEKRGRLDKARKAARDGMLHCPQSELLVLECARLSSRPDAISILQSALKVNHSNSEKIWLQLIAYQTNSNSKKVTLESALRALPKSETLWLVASTLEEGDKHIEMIKRALEILPYSKRLWIEGIKTSNSYEDSQYFIENSLKQLGEDTDILISWSQIEEKYGNTDKCSEICQRIIPDEKRDLISDAEASEIEGFPKTAISIIEIIPFNDNFLIQASAIQRRSHIYTSRALYLRYSTETNDFIPFLKFERENGNIENAVELALKLEKDNDQVVCEICDFLPNISQSIEIIKSILQLRPNSETLSLKLIDLYIESHQLEEAHNFSNFICDTIITPEVYIKTATINEQFGGDVNFLERSIQTFPKEPKFYLLLSLHSDSPLNVLQKGINACPNSSELFIELIKKSINLGLTKPRIRALFEHAKRNCGDQSIIWLYSAEFEPASNKFIVLEEAKKYCRNDVGLIWAKQIELTELESRLSFAKETVEKMGNMKEVVLELALTYWKLGNIDLAKRTLENLNLEHPNWGDGWIFRIKFEKTIGGAQSLKEALGKVENIKITEGFIWKHHREDVMNFEMSQMELLNDVVDLTPDPMVSESSILGDIISLEQ